METTVTQLAPSPARVLRQQISLLGSPGSIASLAVALVGVQIIATTTWIAESLRVIEVPVFNLLPFLVMVAAGWPAIVWQAEGPSKRWYHWSLPVPRAQHDLLRVLAGGIWLAMGIATAAVFQVAVSMMTGDAERVMAVSLGAYLNLVTGPLTVYLLVSALAVATDHPVRWMFAIIFAVMATGSVCVSTLACATSPLLSAVRGFFGLGEVLGAFIVPDVYRVSPTPAGLGEAVKIVLGLFVGCVAVYGATRLRSR